MSNGDFFIPFEERKRQAKNFKTIMKITLDNEDYLANNQKENIKEKILQNQLQVPRSNIKKKSNSSIKSLLKAEDNFRINTEGNFLDFEKMDHEQKSEVLRNKGNIIKDYLNGFIKENEDKDFNPEELDERLKNYSMAGSEEMIMSLKTVKTGQSVKLGEENEGKLRRKKHRSSTHSIDINFLMPNILEKKDPLRTASFFTLTTNIKNNINSFTKQFKKLKTLENEIPRDSRGSLNLKRTSTVKCKKRKSTKPKLSIKLTNDNNEPGIFKSQKNTVGEIERNISVPTPLNGIIRITPKNKKFPSNKNVQLSNLKVQDEEIVKKNALINANINPSKTNGENNSLSNFNLNSNSQSVNITNNLPVNTNTDNTNTVVSTHNLLLMNVNDKELKNSSDIVKSLNDSMKSKLVNIDKVKITKKDNGVNNEAEKNKPVESNDFGHDYNKHKEAGGYTHVHSSPQANQGQLVDKADTRELLRMNLVYDSLSDDEEEEDFDCLIHPHSRFKETWDVLIFLVTLYTIIIVPFTMAFLQNSNFTFTVLDIICDLTYIFDVIIQFFIPFTDNEDKYHTSFRDIASNYLYSWFFVDFLSSLPINTVLNLFNFSTQTVKKVKNDTFKVGKKLTSIAKLSRLYRLMKLIRLLKLIKISKDKKAKYKIKMNILEDLNISSNIRRLLIFFLYFLILNHMLACIWIYLATLDHPSWMTTYDMIDASDVDLYIAALYFNLYTIFTVGYGNIVPQNNYERVYSILIMLVGIMIYTFAVSSLSNIIMQSDEKTLKFNKNLNYLEETRIKYNLPSKLYSKIKRFLSYDYNFNRIDNNILFPDLPQVLRNELICTMHSDIINNFVFFRNTNMDFSARVLMSLRPTKVTRGEIIIKEGEFIEEMVFIKRGILTVDKSYRGHFIKLIDLRRNEHFGEIAMLLNERSQYSLSVKSKYSELFLMKKLDLIDICTDFQDIFEHISNRSTYNMLIIKRKFELSMKNVDKRMSILNVASVKVRGNSKGKSSLSTEQDTLLYGEEEDNKNPQFEIIQEENEDEDEEGVDKRSEDQVGNNSHGKVDGFINNETENMKKLTNESYHSHLNNERRKIKTSSVISGHSKKKSTVKEFSENNTINDNGEKKKTIESFNSEQFLHIYTNSPKSQKIESENNINNHHLSLKSSESLAENLSIHDKRHKKGSTITYNEINTPTNKNNFFNNNNEIYKLNKKFTKSSSNLAHMKQHSLIENFNHRRRQSMTSINNSVKSLYNFKHGHDKYEKSPQKNSSPEIKSPYSYFEGGSFSHYLPSYKDSSNKNLVAIKLSGLKINNPKIRRNTMLINNEINRNIKDGSKNINNPNSFYSDIFEKWKIDEQNRKLDEILGKLKLNKN